MPALLRPPRRGRILPAIIDVGEVLPSGKPGVTRIIDPANPIQPADVQALTMGTSGPSSTYQLGLLVTDSGNGEELTGCTQVWGSSNPSAVTVDNTGLLTAVGAGTAVITATASLGGGSAADTTPAVITVGTPVVASVSRTPATLGGIPGSVGTITLQAKDASGANIPGQTYAANSSDTNIATVSVSGNVVTVTLVAQGTCTSTGHVGAVDSPTTGITVLAPGAWNEPAGMTPWFTLDLTTEAVDTPWLDTTTHQGFKVVEHYPFADLQVRRISNQSWHALTPFPSAPSGLDRGIVCAIGANGSVIDPGEKGHLPRTPPAGSKSLYFRLPSLCSINWRGEPRFKRWYIKGPASPGSIVFLFYASAAGALSMRIHYQFPSRNVIYPVFNWTRNVHATPEVFFVCPSTVAAKDGYIWIGVDGAEVWRETGLDFNWTTLGQQSLLDYVGGLSDTVANGTQYCWLGDGAYASTSTSRIAMPA